MIETSLSKDAYEIFEMGSLYSSHNWLRQQ